MHRCDFTITQNLLPLVSTEKPRVFIGRDPRVFPWDAPARCRSSQPPFPQMTSVHCHLLQPHQLLHSSLTSQTQPATEPLHCQFLRLGSPALLLFPLVLLPLQTAKCHLLRGAPTCQLKQLPWFCFLHHRWTNVLTSLLSISPTSLEPEK